jgi:hypothetical protein
MQRRKVFFTVLLGVVLTGLVWVGTAAAASPGFNGGETESASPAIASTLAVTPTSTLTPTLTMTHPVGLALATYFDVLYDEVMTWHEDGVGFGGIAKAYFLAGALEDEGLTAEDVLVERLSGTGWGRLMKAFGLSPSSRGKNLGWVMSGHGDADDEDESDAVSIEEEGDHPGKGHGPPGKDKTPPGHEKGKTPPGLEKKGKGKGP